MKKHLYFPRTVLRPILISIPPAIALIASIILNDLVKAPGGLYPLIVFSSLLILFTFVFFFRVVLLSKEEIKMIGPFSSKDSSVINEGKTLIITRRSAGRISLDLYGNNGVNADLDWLRDVHTIRDIYLFKSNVVGGAGAIKSILLFFGISKEDADSLVSAREAYKEYPDYTVSVSCPDEKQELRIKFTNTI